MIRVVDTRSKLIDAASAEFAEHGYDGTNTNRIARRAGFAPQTFYRHFEDKTEIFLAVYDAWRTANLETVAVAATRREAARAIIESHRATLRFRRSLRVLAPLDARVGKARAASRDAQIDRLEVVLPDCSRAELAALLFSIERIADAAAEGEFGDLNLTGDDAEAALARRLVWIAPNEEA